MRAQGTPQDGVKAPQVAEQISMCSFRNVHTRTWSHAQSHRRKSRTRKMVNCNWGVHKTIWTILVLCCGLWIKRPTPSDAKATLRGPILSCHDQRLSFLFGICVLFPGMTMCLEIMSDEIEASAGEMNHFSKLGERCRLLNNSSVERAEGRRPPRST